MFFFDSSLTVVLRFPRLGVEFPPLVLLTPHCGRHRSPHPAHLRRHACVRVLLRVPVHPRDEGFVTRGGRRDVPRKRTALEVEQLAPDG